MTTTNTSRLLKLGDTDLTVRSPLEDIRGHTVIDQSGDEIGHVDALLIDDQERKVRFLQIASGGILGIGEQRFLVPVDAVLGVDDSQLVIDQTGERVSGSPGYDPDLVYDRDYYRDLYNYYGYAPYWHPGYTYPAYPY
ncbi:MAG: PRC-barrel domain-containing protein [Chloroflexi bacterium]|nr:PRC-barrel domain-containing protein [Chloroflexota bacterium]